MNRILVIRPDAIGDVVLTLPMIRGLRTHFPQAHITLLMDAALASLLSHHSDIDTIWPDPLARGKSSGVHSLWTSARSLAKENFDLAIHPYSELPYVLLCKLAGIPHQIGDQNKWLLRLFFDVGTPVNYRNITLHTTELNTGLLAPLGIEETRFFSRLVPNNSTTQHVNARLRTLGVQPDDQLVGFHLGTGGNSRAWHPNQFAEVAKGLLAKTASPTGRNLKIVLTGSKREKEAEQRLLSTFSHASLISLVDQLSLDELLSLLSRINVLVSSDTGPYHMAAALGTPVVGLILAKLQKPLRWGPWGARNIILRNTSTCPLPCIAHTCRETFCLDTISPEAVTSGIETLLLSQVNWDEEDAFADWCRHSLTPMIVSQTPESETYAKTLGEIFLKHHQPFVLISQADEVLHWGRAHGVPAAKLSLRVPLRSSINTLIRLIGEREITHIHLLDPVGSTTLRVASHLASLRRVVQLPPLLMSDNTHSLNTLHALTQFYLDHFRNATQFG